jgi:M6 family metalloprotease-like protein
MDRWLNQRHGSGASSLFFSLIILSLVLLPGLVLAMPANPEPFIEEQGDGTQVQLRARGDEHFSWLEDARGYTVVRNNGWLHYAEIGNDGRLIPGALLVGRDDPEAYGLDKRVLPSDAVKALSRRVLPAPSAGTYTMQSGPDAARVAPSGNVKNLVVLIRFADHASRNLPPVSDYETLFNTIGGDPVIAPTGSLKDVYLENSYGQMTLDSDVSPWIQVSGTEAYYANNNGGDSTLWEALNEALDILDQTVDFDQYDTDNDGYIDSIAFIHSGYGAEWGGVLTRIWSHRWAIQIPSGGWQSNEGVRVFDYHISPGLWGTSGTDIGRIGVIAHETGHFFGLPDLYDPDSSAGDGIGSWGLMANSWDFNGSQLCPPHFSPWSKVFLNWYSPTVISDPGQYTINQAETNPEVYQIEANYPNGEYLMIENRQNAGFDCSIPQGGLLIWHIDNDASDTAEGYPGQPNWPNNGNHYRVAVLAADGNYDLEKGNNRGDGGDVHRGGAVDAITTGPGGHPNTDAYQNGNIINTGHTISNISASGPSMTFCLGACNALPAPSGLAAVAAGSTGINLSWTDNSSSETGFTIEHSPNGSNWTTEASVGANVTSYGDTGLVAGSTHYYRVRAYDGSGSSGWSNVANATTDQVAPAAPTGLSALALSSTEIDLTWTDNADNEDSYRIERGPDGINFAIIDTLPANATSYSDSGLTQTTTYFYRVSAVNTVAAPASNVASATTQSPPPEVDHVAYADQFGSGEVIGTFANTQADDGSVQQFTERVSGGKKRDRVTYMGHFWRFNISAGDQVTVFANAWRSETSDNDNFVFAWSDDDVTYHDLFTVATTDSANLQSGTIPASVSGQVWIRVLDTDRTPGNFRSFDSLYVDHLFIRVFNDGPPTAPNAPGGLSATSAGKFAIDLSWTDNSNNEDGFRIERSGDGVNWSFLANRATNVTSFNDTGLAADTTYHYRVLAFNGVGDSAYSASASATTDPDLPPDPPAAPSGMTAVAAGPNSMDLAWTDNADNESGFFIQRSTDGTNFATVASVGVNTTAYTDVTGLQANTLYYYQVYAHNDDGDSGMSNIASATTDEEPPVSLELTANGLKEKGKHVIDLSWSGATSTNVDIFRDGSKIATAPNNGAYSDATGNRTRGATYTHKVCEAGTTVCSNETVTSY